MKGDNNMKILPLAVLALESTDSLEDNPLIIKIKNKRYLINPQKTIKMIDKELRYCSSVKSDIEDFQDGLPYTFYLRKIKAYLRAQVLQQEEHST